MKQNYLQCIFIPFIFFGIISTNQGMWVFTEGKLPTFFYFIQEPHWIAPAGLELPMATRLAWNSLRPVCLCFPSPEIKGMYHYTQFNRTFEKGSFKSISILPNQTCVGTWYEGLLNSDLREAGFCNGSYQTRAELKGPCGIRKCLDTLSKAH